jgi:hypothetical protein
LPSFLDIDCGRISFVGNCPLSIAHHIGPNKFAIEIMKYNKNIDNIVYRRMDNGKDYTPCRVIIFGLPYSGRQTVADILHQQHKCKIMGDQNRSMEKIEE